MRVYIPHFHYMRYARVSLLLSGLLVLAGTLLIIFRGFNFGLEFTGGATIELRFAEPVSVSQVRTLVETTRSNATVIQYGSSRDIQISFAETAGQDSDKLMQDILTAVKERYPDTTLQSQAKVGGQYKAELVENGLIAFLLSCVGMIIYLTFRFEWKFAIGAVIAQVHDVIITAAVFSLTRWTFDLNVLAALLAVLGYSVNDTVVLYDRIRENMRKLAQEVPSEIINISTTQTMTRTVITGFTTILSVLALLFLGGETLFGFSVAMIIGIIVGTYSSIFVASSIVNVFGLKHEDLIPRQQKQIDDLP